MDWKKFEIPIVIFLSIFIVGLTTSHLIAQYVARPSGHIFVGLAHYWEDLFYYFDQINQGANGAWLTSNNFTTEPYPQSFFYFNHVLIGKVGSQFGLSVQDTYNSSVLVLKFVFVLLSYKIIALIFLTNPLKRLLCFLIFLFSSSFPVVGITEEGELSVSSARVYRAANLVFSRFGNVPDALLRSITFLIAVILLFRMLSAVKDFRNRRIPFIVNLVVLSAVLILLTVSDPTKTVLLLISSGVYLLSKYIFEKKDIQTRKEFVRSIILLALAAIPSAIVVMVMFRAIDTDDIYRNALLWDIVEYQKQIGYMVSHPQYFVLAFGFLGIFYMLGLREFYLRNRTNIGRFCLYISLLSLILFFLPLYTIVPIPGFRFIFPVTYVFFSAVALEGLIFFQSKVRLIPFWIVIVLFFIPSAINITNRFKVNMRPLVEPDYHFAYIPDELYGGLQYLKNREPKKSVVLASPISSMDILIPGFTGKKTYSGHFLITKNSQFKDSQVSDFIYKWDAQKAEEFLRKNGIRFYMYTKYDGDVAQIKRDYPFLSIVYENPTVTVFEYKGLTDN